MRALALAACLVLAACGPKAEPDTDGLGASTETPTGKPFTLPAGVTLEGEMYGEAVDACAELTPRGHGGYVAVCFTLRNTTSSAIEVKLPGGLIFISSSTTVQNGLLVQEQIISLPPLTATPIYLHLFCLNADRDVSWYEDLFDFGPITDHPGLEEIVTLMRGRTIDDEDEERVVQWAVWEVTDDAGRISEETRQALRAL